MVCQTPNKSHQRVEISNSKNDSLGLQVMNHILALLSTVMVLGAHRHYFSFVQQFKH